MEPGHHREVSAPGVGVAKGGYGALEVGAGLGGMGLAAFGYGSCLRFKEGRAGAAPAQSVSGSAAPADGSNCSEVARGVRAWEMTVIVECGIS